MRIIEQSKDLRVESRLIALLKKQIEPAIWETMKEYNVILAGGAITSLFMGTPIHDLDLYFKNKEDLLGFCAQINKDYGEPLFASDKACTFVQNMDLPVQAIYFQYFEQPEDIFETFDFTACMGALDMTKEEFILDEYFLPDLTKKVLRVNPKTAFPYMSVWRILKYENKGFTCPRKEYFKLLLAVKDTPMETEEDFKTQIGGMYGNNFDQLFDLKDFTIDKAISQLEDIDLKEMDKAIKTQGVASYCMGDVIAAVDPSLLTTIEKGVVTINGIAVDIKEMETYNDLPSEWMTKEQKTYWEGEDKDVEGLKAIVASKFKKTVKPKTCNEFPDKFKRGG